MGNSNSSGKEMMDADIIKHQFAMLHGKIKIEAEQGKFFFTTTVHMESHLYGTLDYFLEENGFYTSRFDRYGTIKIDWSRSNNMDSGYCCCGCDSKPNEKYNVAVAYNQIAKRALSNLVPVEYLQLLDAAINILKDKIKLNQETTPKFHTFVINTKDVTLVSNIKRLTFANGFSCRTAASEESVKFWIS